MAIEKFRGPDFYLSNMYLFEPGVTTPGGIEVRTSEQLYLPPRFLEKEARMAIQKAPDGFSAKARAKRFRLAGSPEREDWEAVRVPIMKKAILIKFALDRDIREKLLATGEEELVEGNDRGDDFWGVSPPPPDGSGQNMLGRILMETRAAFRDPDFSVDVDELVRQIFS